MLTTGVAEERGAPRFVEGGPVPDAVAQRGVHRQGVVGEVPDDVPVRPAATVFQVLGQVPVVEREPWCDAGVEQPVDQAGVEVQPCLVDGLLDAGIAPWLTLYHWDLPQYLEDRGGWADRDVVGHFTDYALTMHAALGDRVRNWTTFNEPWCAAFLGYAGGQHPPGRQEPQTAVSATHHLLLAHGQAADALRSVDPTAAIGTPFNTTVADPVDPADPADVAAADLRDALINRVFFEPVLLGSYPQAAVDAFASAGTALPIRDGDMEVIRAPVDFIGLNYYQGNAVTAHAPAPTDALPSGAAVVRPTSSPFVGGQGVHAVSRGLPRTAMDWEVQPDGLRRLLERVHHDYTGRAGAALYVTCLLYTSPSPR